MKISQLLKVERYICVTIGDARLWYDTTAKEWVITGRYNREIFKSKNEDSAVDKLAELMGLDTAELQS